MVLIYMAICRASGKRYIGITTHSAAKRWGQHVRSARRDGRDYALHRAIRAHGAETFYFGEIESGLTIEQAVVRERELIVQYGTRSPDGYNLTAGGEMLPGGSHSPETREKLSAANKAKAFSAETRAKMSEAAKNRPPRIHSDEERQARREKQLGQTHSPETRAKLRFNNLGRKFSDEVRAKQSQIRKGKPHSAAHTKAQADARRGKPHTPEAKANMRAGQLRRWERYREQKQEV